MEDKKEFISGVTQVGEKETIDIPMIAFGESPAILVGSLCVAIGFGLFLRKDYLNIMDFRINMAFVMAIIWVVAMAVYKLAQNLIYPAEIR